MIDENMDIEFDSILQQWMGVVEEIYDESFHCHLHDITAGGTYETCDLTYSDINAEDIEMVKLGAIFYWTLGYINGVTKSIIKFKRV